MGCPVFHRHSFQVDSRYLGGRVAAFGLPRPPPRTLGFDVCGATIDRGSTLRVKWFTNMTGPLNPKSSEICRFLA